MVLVNSILLMKLVVLQNTCNRFDMHDFRTTKIIVLLSITSSIRIYGNGLMESYYISTLYSVKLDPWTT